MFANQLLDSCHDVSEGGMLVALSECCFTAGWGVDVRLPEIKEELWGETFFNESSGRFIVSVAPENREQFEKSWKQWHFLGEVTNQKTFELNVGEKKVIQCSVDDLYRCWNREWA